MATRQLHNIMATKTHNPEYLLRTKNFKNKHFLGYKKEIKSSQFDPEIKLEVSFLNEESFNQIYHRISSLSDPQIVTWYIGCNGLKLFTSQFYRDNLIGPLYNTMPNADFWLLDLTAWNAFRDVKKCIKKFSSCCDIIEKFNLDRLHCIRSSEIFRQIEETHDQFILSKMQNIQKMGFIKENSLNYKKNNFITNQLFPNGCPLMNIWLSVDTSRSYSAFQFIEGCFIIKNIIHHIIMHDPQRLKIEIAFVLPNDEYKYYKDEHHTFQKSVNLFTTHICRTLGVKTLDVNIFFMNFKFGKKSSDRPYNVPGQTLKKQTLKKHHIVGSTLC